MLTFYCFILKNVTESYTKKRNILYMTVKFFILKVLVLKKRSIFFVNFNFIFHLKYKKNYFVFKKTLAVDFFDFLGEKLYLDYLGTKNIKLCPQTFLVKSKFEHRREFAIKKVLKICIKKIHFYNGKTHIIHFSYIKFFDDHFCDQIFVLIPNVLS